MDRPSFNPSRVGKPGGDFEKNDVTANLVNSFVLPPLTEVLDEVFYISDYQLYRILYTSKCFDPFVR